MLDQRRQNTPGADSPTDALREWGRTLLAPETYDEVTHDDLPNDVEADFIPLRSEDGSEEIDRRDIDPFQYDSLQAQEAFDRAVEAAAAGDENEAIHQFIRASKIAETAREWHLAAVACQRVGDFLIDPRPPYDVDRAFRMYRRAVRAYEQCGLFGEARELAYRQMCLKMKKAGELKLPLSQRVEMAFHWAVAGFGLRPHRVMLVAMLVVFVYALVYWTTGGVIHAGDGRRPDFWTALYFSGITFTTIGYGDYLPTPGLRLVALTEGFLGAFMVGFFVVVTASRLQKS